MAEACVSTRRAWTATMAHRFCWRCSRGIWRGALIVAVGSVGCGSDERRETTTDSATGTVSAVDTVVPQPVHWQPARLDTLLHAQGFQATRVPLRTRNPFVNVPAASYRVGEAELDVYFFADPVAAARGIGKVAPRRGGPVTTFTSNNMLVVVRSPNADLRRRIRVVLTDPEVEGTLTP
jgi:hypothetical protein